MKFIHTSDIHLGSKFLSFGKNGKKYRSILKQTFNDLIAEFTNGNYDLLLIAGDLFDNPYPDNQEVNFVKGLFAQIPKRKKVVLIPGNHDEMLAGSIYETIKFDTNIINFSDTLNGNRYLEEIDTFIYTINFTKVNDINSELEKAKTAIQNNRANYPSSNHIFLGHGSLNIINANTTTVDKNKLIELKVDYVALGDWHSFLPINTPSKEIHSYNFSRLNSPIFYSGSPELISAKQSGAGYYIRGEINPELVTISRQKISKINLILLKFDTNVIGSLKLIIDKIIEYAGEFVILTVELTGNKSEELNVLELEQELNDKFLRIMIKDLREMNTEIKIEDGTVIAEFNELMNDIITKDPTNPINLRARELGLKYLNSEK